MRNTSKLSKEFILNQSCPFELSTEHQIKNLLPTRNQFAHKGEAGRLLLVAGSADKVGAAILASRAALRSGVGLLYVHVPAYARDIIQTSVPEAMVSSVHDSETISDISIVDKLDALAIGPGIGTNKKTISTFKTLLTEIKVPLVVDADAINILATNPDLLKLLPEDCILTPHPGEFKRLVGAWNNDDERLIKLRSFCQTWNVNTVLKGAFSAVCDKHGYVYFNSTGNPGMATAGSGDVLTGIVGALLAQGLKPIHALRLGVFLHGSLEILLKINLVK